MNKTKIDWPRLDYTWNPVVGCKRDCSYCYAKKINDRFKFIPDWTKPKFFEERLKHPYKVKKPSTIFVGSMADLFHQDMVLNHYYDIKRIIDVCGDNPYHTFMFLTKNAKGYSGLYLPDNCILGLTITEGDQKKINIFTKSSPQKNELFLSIEPLLGSFKGVSLPGINLVIVGAMTGKNAIKPKKEWIESINHHNIYYKNNIKQCRIAENGYSNEQTKYKL